MSSETAPASRIVSGAPEQKPAKKKHAAKNEEDTRAASPGVGKANETDDVAQTSALENAEKHGSIAEETEDAGPKSSPIVENLNKRIKALNKKIGRIHSYAHKPELELNEDQKKIIATLPSLEALIKELEETRKAIQNLEAEQAKAAARQRQEAEEQEKQRIQDILTAERDTHLSRTLRIFDFLRLHSSLAIGDASVVGLNLAGEEYNAVFATVKLLLSADFESRQPILTAFLSEEGDVEGVPVIRLFEILHQYLHPQVPEEPLVEEVEVQPEAADVHEVEVAQPEAVVGISPAVPAASGQMSFRFVQESELDEEPVEFEHNVEWVEKEGASETPASEPVIAAEYINGTYATQTTEAVNPAGDSNINWADDEGGLPSIAGLQASFAASGSVTPTGEGEERKAALESSAPESEGAQAADEDGFTQARGGRGMRRGIRGSGRGGEPRGDRGGFRGAPRRDFRAGERGQGSRGRGRDPGNRGGAEGSRGGRGRGRGDHRGNRGGRVRAGPPPQAENAE